MGTARSWTLEGDPMGYSEVRHGMPRPDGQLEPGERVRVVPLDDVLEALREEAARWAEPEKGPPYTPEYVFFREAADFLEARFSTPEGGG